MKFGKVDLLELVDFAMPKTDPKTFEVLSKYDKANFFIVCTKWNRADLKGFYPRCTKDELEYYSILLN